MAVTGPRRLSIRVLGALLSVFFVVVLTQLVLQFYVEYNQVTNEIKEDLAGLEEIFSEPLRDALWASSKLQIEALAHSITKLSFVTGIEIVNEESRLKITQFKINSSDLFHGFKIYYTFEGQSVYLADVTVYSDHSVIYNILKTGFLFLVGQIVFLASVLTILFNFVIKKYLTTPLDDFVGEIWETSRTVKEGDGLEFNVAVRYAEFEPLLNVLNELGKKITSQFKNLQELAGRLLSIQEEERRRLARELHDDLAQRLALLSIETGRLNTDGCSSEASEIVSGVQKQLVDLSEDIHRISRQLHPSIIEDLGLEEALRSEISNFSRLENIPVEFEYGLGAAILPLDIAVTLYRVTQESLRNIKKHAQAKNVIIKLDHENEHLVLTVSDDGRGFNPDIVKGLPGLGLKSMRERMRLIGGSISYISRQGQGTIVEARVKVPS